MNGLSENILHILGSILFYQLHKSAFDVISSPPKTWYQTFISFKEMTTEVQSQVNADWRARQKERERERRRMRDRQRRQSMSVEEREKHLARRRKNYQLRRQRAATSHEFGFEQHSLTAKLESDTFSDVNLQQDDDDDNNAEETMYEEVSYKYPRLPRLIHIRKLARVLNASSEDAESANQISAVRSRIRLIHVKHLARALHSSDDKHVDLASSSLNV